jgi:hypothetical protein
MGPAPTGHGSRNGCNAKVAAIYCGEAYFGSRPNQSLAGGVQFLRVGVAWLDFDLTTR